MGSKVSVWVDPAKIVAATGAKYGVYTWLTGGAGFLSLLFLYIFLLIILTPAAKIMGINPKHYVPGFTFIYWIAYLCWIIGH